MPNMVDVYSLGKAVGMGVTSASIVWLAADQLKSKTPLISRLPMKDKLMNLLPKKEGGMTKEDRNIAICGFVGAALLALLGRGTSYMGILVFVGMGLGAGIGKGFYTFHRTAELYTKRRQVAVLFEAVEMYLRSNMSLKQALFAAKSLTPQLNKAVSSCIIRWPANPDHALEMLRKEIGVPEADVLVSLLVRINQTGSKNLEGVIQREAQNIDKLRQVAARMKISNRPMYFMLQRALPAIAVLGMFLGSMYHHLASSLTAAGLSIF